MADVTLNLKYNDNGASVAVNSLVSQLSKLETQQWRINISGANAQQLQQLEQAAKRFEETTIRLTRVQTENGVRSVRSFAASFTDLENALKRVNAEINSQKQNLIKAFSTRDFSGIENITKSLDELALRKEYVESKLNAIILKPAIQEFRSLGEEIEHTVKNAINYSDFIDSITKDLNSKFSNMRKSGGFSPFVVDQEYREQRRIAELEEIKQLRELDELALSIGRTFGEIPQKYVDEWADASEIIKSELAKLAEDQKEVPKEVADAWVENDQKMLRAMKQGQSQFWSGVQRTATATITLIRDTWNSVKNVMEAPLNLTGVSQFASLLESLEGSIVLSKISSNFTTGLSESVTRFDILRSYPAVLENIGYSADEANASLDRMYESVLGLPTAFEDIVDVAQYFTLMLGDLNKATDLAIAANNAFVASGANSQQISSGMRQLQYLIEGTKLRSTQWYSLIRSMPLALREVGDALGYADFPSFTAALKEGSVATEDLIDQLIEVGLHSETLGGIIDVMKGRVEASLTNVGNAAKRLGNTILDTLDKTLQKTGGKGIAENIKSVSGIIDHIAEVAAQWISTHGDQIQALIDKFMSIDWASVIPNFFQGLVNFASNALDNVGNYITEIGGLITTAKQFFNDIENSRTIAVLGSFGTGLKDILGIFGGASQIYAGYKLASGNVLPAAAGGAVAGGSTLGTVAGYAAILTGLIAGGDLAYNIGKYGWKEGVKRSIATPYASAIVPEYLYKLEEDDAKKREQILKKRAVELPGVEFDELNRFQTSVLQLYSEMQDAQKLYDEALSEYMSRLDAVDVRRQRIEALIEELKAETDSWEYLDSDYFEKIYGEGGFLSQQVSKASGWLYRNTTEDFINVQKEFAELLPEVNDSIISAIEELATPEERSKALEAWANVLNNLDPTDADSIAKLKTMQTEGGESIVSTLLLPQYEADEVLSTNKDKIKELRLKTLEAIGEPLDDEEEAIIKEIENDSAVAKAGQAYEKAANEMSEKYMPGIRNGLYQFSNDVVRAIQEMIDGINNRQFRIVPDVIYRNPQIEPPREGVYSASGGFMFAPRGTDTIPAMLTPGEFVQRRAAVEHFGREFMNRINQLDLNGALRSLRIAVPYATGGIVKNDSRSYRDNHAVVNQTFNHSSGNFGLRRANRFVRALG